MAKRPSRPKPGGTPDARSIAQLASEALAMIPVRSGSLRRAVERRLEPGEIAERATSLDLPVRFAISAVPELVEALRRDEDAGVRRAAAFALGAVGPSASSAVPELVEALRRDEDAGVRRAAAFALGAVGGERPAPSRDVRRMVEEVVAEPEAWLRTPNRQFGNRAPGDLLGTDEESKVRDLLSAVELGLY